MDVLSDLTDRMGHEHILFKSISDVAAFRDLPSSYWPHADRPV